MNRHHFHSSRYFPAYPNEADTNYYIGKLVALVAGGAMGLCLTGSLVLMAMLM